MKELEQYRGQISEIISSGLTLLSSEKPSEFAERKIVMKQPFPGRFKYDKTPYTREIVDCLAPDHPCRWLAFMKGLQIGASAGVILPGLAWIIANSPANTYFTVGSPDLVDKASEKLDLIIDSADLRKLIRPQTLRKRNNNTGDKNQKKDFSGGYIVITSANNHRNWRDVSLKYGFFDDCEAFKGSSKEAGSTVKLIEGRFAAYKDVMKQFWISTPELKETSIIEPLYLQGDQRKYLIPCPCCHEFIEIVWSAPIDEKTNAGIYYELDNQGNVIQKSVGYICQKCAGFFKDNHKQKMLMQGHWQPNAIPTRMGFYSYHLSSLYAPEGMYDWYHYAVNYNEANPPNQPRKEKLHQTFVNTTLGLTYEMDGESPNVTEIQKNIRPYEVGIIPDNLSQADGNGRICLITCACDMNGKQDDARLDYEIVAWSEKGARYDITHGSIGTFQPKEHQTDKRVDRQHWTYDMHKENSVWYELDKIIGGKFKGDNGFEYGVGITGIDVGYKDFLAYAYMDWTNNNVVAIRGDKEEQYISENKDIPYFRIGKARKNYYLLSVGFIKDDLAEYMQLKWDKKNDDKQPNNFINFPTPSGGKYLYDNFFGHWESEHRTMITKRDGNTEFRWVKKQSNSQNHLFDCSIYNMALREIEVFLMGRSYKAERTFKWRDYCSVVLR